MWIVGMLIFIINGFFCIFSLNLVLKQSKRPYMIHGIIFFILSMSGIYLYLREYLLEAFITFFVLGGVPVLFEENILPSFIKKKNTVLTYLLLISLLVCTGIYLFEMII